MPVCDFYPTYVKRFRSDNALKRATNCCGNLVKFLAGWVFPITSDFHGVVFKPGDDKEMNMKDFLVGSFAVGQEQVYPVAIDSGIADSPAYAHRGFEKLHTRGLIHIRHVGEMLFSDNDNLSAVQGGDVHESQCCIIIIYNTGGCFASDDITEYTVAHITYQSLLQEAHVLQFPDEQVEQELLPVPGMVLATPPGLAL